MMTGYIHNTPITELVKKETKTKVEFLKRYNLTEICDTKVLKCMHVLGFYMKSISRNTTLIVTKFLVLFINSGSLLADILKCRGGCIYGFRLRSRKI